jgi:putative transposase
MPRAARDCPAGTVFHVLNRSVARLKLFEKKGDYLAFEEVLAEAHEKIPLPIFAYCVMPNHWHFVVQPEDDHQVTDFFRWLTHTHTMRWHVYHKTSGTGHLYQGRFKSFPIESNHHLLCVLRYVERNPVRAKLCQKAEHWRFGSAWRSAQHDLSLTSHLSPWPIQKPKNWAAWVNSMPSPAETEAIQKCAIKSSPYGTEKWISQSAARLGLEHTLRPCGRPKIK